MTRKIILAALVAPLALAACSPKGTMNGVPLLAVDNDGEIGFGTGPINGKAAVAITPDGCEAWVIDDGVEGYATTRSDPRSGLPVCTSEIPPGSVVGNPQNTSFPDVLAD